MRKLKAIPWATDTTALLIWIFSTKPVLDCTNRNWNWCRNLFGKEKNLIKLLLDFT